MDGDPPCDEHTRRSVKGSAHAEERDCVGESVPVHEGQYRPVQLLGRLEAGGNRQRREPARYADGARGSRRRHRDHPFVRHGGVSEPSGRHEPTKSRSPRAILIRTSSRDAAIERVFRLPRWRARLGEDPQAEKISERQAGQTFGEPIGLFVQKHGPTMRPLSLIARAYHRGHPRSLATEARTDLPGPCSGRRDARGARALERRVGPHHRGASTPSSSPRARTAAPTDEPRPNLGTLRRPGRDRSFLVQQDHGINRQRAPRWSPRSQQPQ